VIGRLLGQKEEGPIRPHEGPVSPDEPKKRGARGKSGTIRAAIFALAMTRTPANTCPR